MTQAKLNDPVTKHLHQDFTRLAAGLTVGEALDWLRRNPPQERIIYFYVVDGGDHLLGVVPTRRLLLSPPETPLADIMVRTVIALPAEATVLDACEFFIRHRLLAFPIVDADRRVVGVVDVELYADELGALDEAHRRNELFQMIGVRAAAGQHESPLGAFRRRFPWLWCNIAAGLLAALLSGVYERELAQVVALAFFIPVVLNLAESVSSQSVSLTLQLLHGRPPTWRAMLPRLRDELATGVLLGLGSGSVIALVALVWLGQGRLAACLAGGITGGVTVSAMLGLAIPMGLRLLRLEPRVAAGPVALAGADVVTILVYLNLARWLFA
ncbi:MAG TPA: magnesium transporter [Gemmataceae bacterium]